jgi:hypothetical protein
MTLYCLHNHFWEDVFTVGQPYAVAYIEKKKKYEVMGNDGRLYQVPTDKFGKKPTPKTPDLFTQPDVTVGQYSNL